MARVTPERRTRVDLIVTALIVVTVAAAGTLAWYVSPVRHTELTVAKGPVPAVAAAEAVPTRLVPAWQAESQATAVPAIADATVITGSGGAVIGRSPASGRELWSYTRDRDLCTLDAAWPSSADLVLAVYRTSRGCSDVTALEATTGARKGARSSDADPVLRLISDSGYVLAQGPARLETWGSNLVRGIEYGRVEAPVRPDAQPGRADCRFFSSGIAGDRISVIERCADEPGYRLTVLGAVLDDDEKITQYGSTIITDSTTAAPPVLVTMTNSAIAIYDGGANATPAATPAVRVFDSDGVETGTFTVKGPAQPPADSYAIDSSSLITYWTGTSTLVFDANSARPIFEVPETLGAGDVMANRLLLPSRSGISVRDLTTLREVGSIALERSGPVQGPVSLRVIGTTVVEQRGSRVEAFTPPPAG